jgi:diacylglycerol kinase family enzyme
MSVKLAIIMSKGSGKNSLAFKYEALKAAAAAHDLEPEFFLVSNGEEATAQAKAAVERGILLIAAAGGDGTLSAVATGLIPSAARLGVLPLGTFNHFAADLGIPNDMEGALEVLKNGVPLQVDVGEVNGLFFLNNSSVGIYPRLVHERDEDRARRSSSKLMALIRAAFKLMWKYPTLALKIKLDGREMIRRTAFVFIGNNEYILEGLRMGKRETMATGKLTIGVAHRTMRLDLIRIFFKALLGRLKHEMYFDEYQVAEAHLDSRKRFLRVSLDGEVKVVRTPLHYCIHPKALTVMVPQGGEGSR